MVHPGRIRKRNQIRYKRGVIVYWMGRDQRLDDNHALLAAAELAKRKGCPARILFVLPPTFEGATWRHYDFLVKGLKEIEQQATAAGYPFDVIPGLPDEVVPSYVEQHEVGAIVSDFNPLRVVEYWKSKLALDLNIPCYEVDAHNVVPTWIASTKHEFAARLLRPKLEALYPEYLSDFPDLPNQSERHQPIDWERVIKSIRADDTVRPVPHFTPGPAAGHQTLKGFLTNQLPSYDVDRNNPNLDGQSNLSPYLHFGHISPQRVAFEVQRADAPDGAKKSFMNELVVWRELSDNFTFFEPNYDNLLGAADWAQKTLNTHRNDPREFVYSQAEWDSGQIHDDLWNACQAQLRQTGKLHGYLRMYWAKKILEWSESPEEAIRIAVYLNDRYSIDGNDPNGYAGVMWSIAGVHDRPWFNRPVYGAIRYMSRSGCEKKFDVPAYVRQWSH